MLNRDLTLATRNGTKRFVLFGRNTCYLISDYYINFAHSTILYVNNNTSRIGTKFEWITSTWNGLGALYLHTFFVFSLRIWTLFTWFFYFIVTTYKCSFHDTVHALLLFTINFSSGVSSGYYYWWCTAA